ncbi:ATP-dependent RNA helicase RhlE [Geothermobacter ehrlichii]|uniref:ATP-dependent RNA helicase RhlE n=1 Tax=Geothermobacter ehrlichii TaxID=213224 RepID=A0A5D3WHY5_9BACT|nr:DEAD/DEAH box helicase [Geothermobacter ehrlichii]TYO97470.1 ATP-dependent RNA helicase RhlE [Geothermobacter ehrlichii]
MSFTQLQLAAPILRAIAQCGYTEPTPIQKQSIPEILAGRDLLGSAQTGTGKTAAFMLPVLHRLAVLKKGPKGAPRVLVMTPTRELAAQVIGATRDYGRFLRLRSAVILGGSAYGPQFRDLGRPIDLVVGTPGRLIDHLERGSLDLSRLEVLILDEADRMLDMGFKEDVEKVVAAAPAGRQTLLFTATLDRTMENLARRLLNDPVRVDIAGRKPTLDQIAQRLHVADNVAHKKRLLQHCVEADELRQAIIFSATKRDADALARELAAQGHRAAALHGDMSQGMRNRTVRDLRQGRVRLLVATDVAARGIDVPGISHVINFDLPMAAEDYIHRIGRTGRAGASGTAISFASNGADVQRLERIERLLGECLPQVEIPGLEPTRPLRRARPAGKRPGRSGGKGYGGFKRGKGKPGTQRRREPVVEYRSCKGGTARQG